MLDALTDDCFVVQPNGANSAYGTVIRRTESARDIEYRVFEQITAAMQEAAHEQAQFTARIQAAHRNRELWQTLAYDLASEGNALPAELRARLISLAIWVSKETEQITRGVGSLEPLIAVNRNIMQGLCPSQQAEVR
jgi:flagellar protein FlaF